MTFYWLDDVYIKDSRLKTPTCRAIPCYGFTLCVGEVRLSIKLRFGVEHKVKYHIKFQAASRAELPMHQGKASKQFAPQNDRADMLDMSIRTHCHQTHIHTQWSKSFKSFDSALFTFVLSSRWFWIHIVSCLSLLITKKVHTFCQTGFTASGPVRLAPNQRLGSFAKLFACWDWLINTHSQSKPLNRTVNHFPCAVRFVPQIDHSISRTFQIGLMLAIRIICWPSNTIPLHISGFWAMQLDRHWCMQPMQFDGQTSLLNSKGPQNAKFVG